MHSKGKRKREKKGNASLHQRSVRHKMISSFCYTVRCMNLQHPPSGRAVYSHLPHERAVLLPVQCLGHSVGDFFTSRDVLEFKLSLFDFIMYEVMSDFDVLGPIVELGVFHDGDGGLVIHVECSWAVVG